MQGYHNKWFTLKFPFFGSLSLVVSNYSASFDSSSLSSKLVVPVEVKERQNIEMHFITKYWKVILETQNIILGLCCLPQSSFPLPFIANT